MQDHSRATIARIATAGLVHATYKAAEDEMIAYQGLHPQATGEILCQAWDVLATLPGDTFIIWSNLLCRGDPASLPPFIDLVVAEAAGGRIHGLQGQMAASLIGSITPYRGRGTIPEDWIACVDALTAREEAAAAFLRCIAIAAQHATSRTQGGYNAVPILLKRMGNCQVHRDACLAWLPAINAKLRIEGTEAVSVVGSLKRIFAKDKAAIAACTDAIAKAPGLKQPSDLVERLRKI